MKKIPTRGFIHVYFYTLNEWKLVEKLNRNFVRSILDMQIMLDMIFKEEFKYLKFIGVQILPKYYSYWCTKN